MDGEGDYAADDCGAKPENSCDPNMPAAQSDAEKLPSDASQPRNR